MKCITIEKQVDAWHVEWLLLKAKQEWSSLPVWFKKMHQENKIMIGGSKIQVETENYNVEADSNDVVFLKDDGFLDVLPKEKFYKIYRDLILG